MAAIEKICEFGSEEYLGYQMRDHKKNLIQVNPSARRNFKNKKATLIIHAIEWRAVYKQRGEIQWSGSPSEDDYYSSTFNWYVPEYTYSLNFDQDELQGIVEGKYLNYTYDLGTTIRKLKRLVGGNKYLTIKKEITTKDKSLYKYNDIVKSNV